MSAASADTAPRPIVFIDDAHTFGGAQIALAWAIRAIVRNTAYSVVCICTKKTKETIVGIVGSGESRLTFAICPPALPLSIVSFPIHLIPFIKLLWSLKRRGVGFWWLNLSGLESCLAAAVALKIFGARHAAWLHCTEAISILVPERSLFRRVLHRARDLVAECVLIRIHPVLATPSRAASDILRKRTSAASAISHLYPTVGILEPPVRDTPNGSEGITLWMIGRIQFGQKNNMAAVETLRELKRRGIAVRLNIVGDGPDREGLLAASADLVSSKDIRFLGWNSNPWSEVYTDDIVLIPSFWEGMPLTAIEAMLRGIRIVTSPLPMFYEGVPDTFIASGFSGEHFANQVERVITISQHEVRELYCTSLLMFSADQFIRTFGCLSDGDVKSEMWGGYVAA